MCVCACSLTSLLIPYPVELTVNNNHSAHNRLLYSYQKCMNSWPYQQCLLKISVVIAAVDLMVEKCRSCNFTLLSRRPASELSAESTRDLKGARRTCCSIASHPAIFAKLGSI